MQICRSEQQLSLLPVDGDFPLAGRPYAAWRRAGSPTFTESLAPAVVCLHEEGQCWTGSCDLGPLRLFCTVQIDGNGALLGGHIQNTGQDAVEVARVHYLHGTVGEPDVGLLCLGGPDRAKLVKPGEEVPSFNDRTDAGYAKAGVVRKNLIEPVHATPNWSVSEDSAVLTEAWDKPGWFIGAIGPGTAFGEIGVKTDEETLKFFAGVFLEGVRVQPGQTRPLERLRLRFGDWQEGIRGWTRDCALEMGTRPVPHPPAGYCSWYQCWDGVTEDDILAAAEQFFQEPVPPGGRLVQLDDGFQKMPGDWRPNERFEKHWGELPAAIAAGGSVPGLWLAPALMHEIHPTVQEHPDWVQRTPDGAPATSWANWGWVTDPERTLRKDQASRTYFLDVDHPDVQAFMRDIIDDAVRQGWTYLKLDFTNRIASGRVKTANRTSFESYRELYRLFREAAGAGVTINACIGCPGRFALGFADAARLGGDIGANWATVQQNLRPLLLSVHTNGAWWAMDPDVWFMREASCNLTRDERFLLAGTIGMMGGMFLTSDFPEQWDDEVRGDLRPFWSENRPRTPRRNDVVFDGDGGIRAYIVEQENRDIWVGLYNWRDKTADIVLPFGRLPCPDRSVADIELARVIARTADKGSVELQDTQLRSVCQPAHSLRIAVFQEAQTRTMKS
jgi:hypothetical protein